MRISYAIASLIILILLPLHVVAEGNDPLIPPSQPLFGPGGTEAAYAEVEARRFGEAPDGFWIFRPAPIPDDVTPLPIVVFLHGYTQLDPEAYRAWIDHITKRGAVVIYPDYQDEEHLGADFEMVADTAAEAVQRAVGLLVATDQPVDASRITLVGHSVGGILSVLLADQSRYPDLPPAEVIFSVQPGGCRDCGNTPEGAGVPIPPTLILPEDSALVFLTGDADLVVGTSGAAALWPVTDELQRRAWVTVPSDVHGDPPLVSDHLLAETLGPNAKINAHDWMGTWGVLDQLMLCASEGGACEAVLRNEPFAIDLGEWSDGTPVNPIMVWPGPPEA